ncbi:MAG: hypothetical protein R6X33_05140 [Candidatus Brocadiia bacterium]
MKRRFSLLLLDANVVIELFRQGIWETLIDRCDVSLSRTVAEVEAQFYEDEEGGRHYFDVTHYARQGRISVFDATVSGVGAFRERFDSSYVERMDPGETESLVYLLDNKQDAVICSADAIVYRILGNMRLSRLGISLEEVLEKIGLGRALPSQFTKESRERWTQRGFEESMRGIGHAE